MVCHINFNATDLRSAFLDTFFFVIFLLRGIKNWQYELFYLCIFIMCWSFWLIRLINKSLNVSNLKNTVPLFKSYFNVFLNFPPATKAYPRWPLKAQENSLLHLYLSQIMVSIFKLFCGKVGVANGITDILIKAQHLGVQTIHHFAAA